MKYMDFNTGEIWELEDLKKVYNDSLYYGLDDKFDNFEDYLEDAILKGIRREDGGLIEVEDK